MNIFFVKKFGYNVNKIFSKTQILIDIIFLFLSFYYVTYFLDIVVQKSSAAFLISSRERSFLWVAIDH